MSDNRNLVFSSVGDNNSTSSWIQSESPFDIAISFYVDDVFDNRKNVNYFHRIKGYKIANFLKCVCRFPEILNNDYFRLLTTTLP